MQDSGFPKKDKETCLIMTRRPLVYNLIVLLNQFNEPEKTVLIVEDGDNYSLWNQVIRIFLKRIDNAISGQIIQGFLEKDHRVLPGRFVLQNIQNVVRILRYPLGIFFTS